MWNLFKVVNLFYLLVSSYAWFAFLLPGNYISLAVSVLMLIMYATANFKMSFTPRFMVLLTVLLLYGAYSAMTLNLLSGVQMFLTYLPAALIFTLDKSYQLDLLKSVSKWLCILIAISFVYYLIAKVIPLPHTTFIVPNNDFYYPYDNYFLFLDNPIYKNAEAGILRFGAFFLEPGHLAMTCCLMLFALRYQFRDYPWLWITLPCILFSFSLTGYLIFVIGWMLLKIRNIVNVIMVVVVIAGSWLFVTDIWNGGNNAVNILVVQRLEPDKEKGIKGNNRTIKKTDAFYRQCVKDGRIWIGVGQKDMGERVAGSGYKIFLLRYGIIGTIFVVLIYLCLINPRANRRYAYSFLLVMFLLFLQRAYPSWYSWLFYYTAGIGVMRGEPFFTAYQRRKFAEKEARKRRKRNRAQTGMISNVH